MLDENVNWQKHIYTVENKILGYSTVHSIYLMNHLHLKCIYFAYIHSCLNYTNIGWASTY